MLLLVIYMGKGPRTVLISAGPKGGGPGGHVPPEEAVNALKKHKKKHTHTHKNALIFHALYDIVSTYGNA